MPMAGEESISPWVLNFHFATINFAGFDSLIIPIVFKTEQIGLKYPASYVWVNVWEYRVESTVSVGEPSAKSMV